MPPIEKSSEIAGGQRTVAGWVRSAHSCHIAERRVGLEAFKQQASAVVLRTAGITALAVAVASASALHAQLTVTPGRTAATAAGTGALGFSGDGAAATAATLAAPRAVAYDAAGNLYIADTRNHAVREVLKASGNIVTVAGVGLAGFAGDNGSATSALLDTPTGIAVDAAGNLYIADSRNHRIRKVAGGVITTVAGTGVAGFSGDGGPATAAALALPSGIAIDASGNLYIADTDNQRIRKVTGTTITTVAGNGDQAFAGDGAAATAAALDSPVGVAVDAAGNLYIADTHNQRIRLVTAATGLIGTLAGSGTPTFAGGFAGDNAAASSAALSKPTGVSVDAAGNVYVADTNNQRIRQLGPGSGATIATVAGTGSQGFGNDGGLATAAILNAPRAAVPDSTGNLAVADALNQRIRTGLLPTLTFAAQAVGTTSAAQTVTLANSGGASLTVTALAFTSGFAAAAGGTCTALPITLAAGASCTQSVAFTPTATGAAAGSLTLSGTGTISQKVLLAGTATVGTATVAVTSTAINYGSTPTTLQATVSGAGVAPTGAVTLQVDGGTAQPASCTTAGSTLTCSASYSTGSLTVGAHTLTAAYAGDSNYSAANGTGTLTVNDTLASLTVTAIPAKVSRGRGYAATVTAIGASGAVFTGFTGTVNLSSTDPSALFSPSSYTYTAADAGTHSFTVFLSTLGSFSVSATSGSISGTQAGIQVGGYIWTVSDTAALGRVDENGTAVNTTAGGANTSLYGGIAFDSAGNTLSVVSSRNSLVHTTNGGTGSYTLTGAGLNQPAGVAVDGAGSVWVANGGNNSVSVFNSTGTAVSGASGFGTASVTAPSAVVIDGTGGVWTANRTAGTVTHLFGAATPVVTPASSAVAADKVGVKP